MFKSNSMQESKPVEQPKFATKGDIQDFKDQVNDSFEEVSNMFLELQQGLQLLEERIARYNERSSHKI